MSGFFFGRAAFFRFLFFANPNRELATKCGSRQTSMVRAMVLAAEICFDRLYFLCSRFRTETPLRNEKQKHFSSQAFHAAVLVQPTATHWREHKDKKLWHSSVIETTRLIVAPRVRHIPTKKSSEL